MSLMGIDVGTTGCKAAVFSLDGELLALAYREYPLVHPKPGFTELDPELIWASVAEVIREANAGLAADPAQALAVSCQGEAVVPVDTAGSALGNFIVTFDHRTRPQAEWWEATVGSRALFAMTGMPLHPMYSICKILWIRDNAPELFARTRRFLCVEDFINLRLAGEPVIDWSLAGRTMAFDVRKHRWSTEVLRWAGLSEDLLARPLSSGSVVGPVRAGVAEALGFRAPVMVAAGGHDQPCGALGAGIVEPGMGMNATGTSDVILCAFPRPVLTQRMLRSNYCCYSHVDPSLYVTISFNLTGGLLLRWHRDVLCEAEVQAARQRGGDPYEIIVAEASDEPRPLFFLPHFVGAGTPYLDSDSRGALVGLTIDTTKRDLSRAVLDSVNYEAKLNIARLAAAGCPIRELRAIGGGAKSERWLQMKSDCFGLPVSSMHVSEAATLGAAMLGGVACGRFRDAGEASQAMVHVARRFEPDPVRREQYERIFPLYQELYPALRRLNHRIARAEA